MPYGDKKSFGNPKSETDTGRRNYKRPRPDDSSASASASSSLLYPPPPGYRTFAYVTDEEYINKFEHLDKKHKYTEEELNKNKESLRQSQLEQANLNKDLEELNGKKRNQGWVGWFSGSQKDIDNQIKCCTDNINKNKEYCSKLEGEISELCKTESSIISSKKDIREKYDNSETDNISGSTVSIRTYNDLYINSFLEQYIRSQFGIELYIYNKAFGSLIEKLKNKIIEMYGLNIDQHKISKDMLIDASEQIDVFKSQDYFKIFLDKYRKKEPVNNRSVGPLFSLTRPVEEAPSFSHDSDKKPAKSKKRGSGRRSRRSRKSKK
jgi:hypothetical protein